MRSKYFFGMMLTWAPVLILNWTGNCLLIIKDITASFCFQFVQRRAGKRFHHQSVIQQYLLSCVYCLTLTDLCKIVKLFTYRPWLALCWVLLNVLCCAWVTFWALWIMIAFSNISSSHSAKSFLLTFWLGILHTIQFCTILFESKLRHGFIMVSWWQ